MKVISNKRLDSITKDKICINVENGAIQLQKEDGTIFDITNDILELVVVAVEDNQTFCLWNRKINISVSEIED